MSDTVNHPRHYNAHPSGVECIAIAEHMGFNVGNAVKYLWRAGLKSADPIEDLKKAVWYAQREIRRLECRDPELPLKERRDPYLGSRCPDCGTPEGLDHVSGCMRMRTSGDTSRDGLCSRCDKTATEEDIQTGRLFCADHA